MAKYPTYKDGQKVNVPALGMEAFDNGERMNGYIASSKTETHFGAIVYLVNCPSEVPRDYSVAVRYIKPGHMTPAQLMLDRHPKTYGTKNRSR